MQQQLQGGNINDMMQARMCQNKNSQSLPKFNNFVASQRYIPFQSRYTKSKKLLAMII